MGTSFGRSNCGQLIPFTSIPIVSATPASSLSWVRRKNFPVMREIVQDYMCFFLNSFGVTPVHFLNALLKTLGSENPKM